jgi:enoyl-CoA hydratase/carnithine racemase
MELNFSLTLSDALYHELIEACEGSRCSPTQFAAETLEGALASRRLPRMWTQGAAHGAFTSGYRKAAEPEDAAEAGLVTHRVLSPGDMLEML